MKNSYFLTPLGELHFDQCPIDEGKELCTDLMLISPGSGLLTKKKHRAKGRGA